MIKLMTYNIQHGLDYKKILNNERIINLKSIIDVINNVDPDILSLNEVYNDLDNHVSVLQAKYIANALEKINHCKYYYYFGKAIKLKNNIEYGNAIISKYPFVYIRNHYIMDPIIKDKNSYYEPRIIIESKIKINDKIMNVFVSHFGLAKQEQNIATDLIEYYTSNKNNVVFMGDLNMEEDNQNIIKLKKHLKDTGEIMEDDRLTYPSINPKKKIDYIFTSNDVLVNKAYVLKMVSSDHFPVVAYLDI